MNLKFDSKQGMELDQALADRLHRLSDPDLDLDMTKEDRERRTELTRGLMASLQQARFPRRKARIRAKTAAENQETEA